MMSSRILPALLGTTLTSGLFLTPASATELAYRWEKGKTQHFVAQSKDTIAMSGMGFDLTSKFRTDVAFSLAIQKVKKDGTAEGKLSIESFTVQDESGQTMATLQGLPPSALVSLVDIDRKGAFRFKQELELLVDEEGQNMVVSGHASPTEASATAQADGQEVTVWASFDPKTGQLSGGAKIKEIGKKKKKVKVRTDKPTVDLLPKQFLELLRLPDGDVGGGAEFSVAAPGMSNQTKVTGRIVSISEEKAEVETKFVTESKANVVDQNDEGAEAFPAMPGTGGMPRPEAMQQMMGGMGGGGAGAGMGISVDGQSKTTMNPMAGKLDRVEGTIRTKTSAGGMMSMSTETELELTRKD